MERCWIYFREVLPHERMRQLIRDLVGLELHTGPEFHDRVVVGCEDSGRACELIRARGIEIKEVEYS